MQDMCVLAVEADLPLACLAAEVKGIKEAQRGTDTWHTLDVESRHSRLRVGE